MSQVAENAENKQEAQETQAPQAGAPISVSEKAAKEIQRLISTESNPGEQYLRVMVVGGGCSGMSYKLGFESKALEPGDKSFEDRGVRIVIDQKSLLYLSGTQLDFSDGLNGTGFTFSNPNAKRTCGCGTSFSV